MVELLTGARKDELAKTYQLGSFQKEYRVTTSTVRGGMALLLLGGVAYLLTCVIAALRAPDSLVASVLIGLIPCGILSGIGTLVFWLGKRWVTRRCNWRIYLYEHGLIYHGQGLYPMHWKNVQSIIHTASVVYYGSGVAVGHDYKIYCKDGIELAARGVIDGTFKEKSQLIQTIEQRSAPYLLDEALNHWKSTGQVSFGKLTVNQQGLLVQGKFLPWQEFKSFSLDEALVVFRKKGKRLAWRRCPIEDIINYEVSQQLVNMLRRN